MKKFKYIWLLTLVAWKAPLLAMNALQKKQAEIKQKAAEKIQKAFRKRRGQGITVFGSPEKPISLELEKVTKTNNSNWETIDVWYPTPEALEKMLKEHVGHIPNVFVKKSDASGANTGAIFVAYPAGPREEQTPLFFLKISRADLTSVPQKLDALQKGPIGRFGVKALSNRDLPIIVLQEMFFTYKGNDNKIYTIEVMHPAHGKQLSRIMRTEEDIDDPTHPNYGKRTPETAEYLKLVQKCAEKVGKALGLLHVEFMNYHNSNLPLNWTTLIHGDFHMGNVFFDDEKSRVYFIDNEKMKENKSPIMDFNILVYLTDIALTDMVKSLPLRKYENFLLYFIEGYLSAYPLEKRKYIAAYLKDLLGRQINLKLQYYTDNKYQRFYTKTETFMNQLNAVFNA